MTPFLYLDRPSRVHALDPRTKLFLLVASFVAAILFDEPLPPAVLLLLLLLYGGAGAALGNLRRVWLPLLTIALLAISSWSLLLPGRTPIVWRLTWEGLSYGVAAALKIDAMIVSGLIFLSTTRIEEILLGLMRLRVPFPAAFAFSLGIRMVPTIIGTAVTVAEAQRSRGLDLRRGGPIRRLRSYVPLLVPVFLHTLRNTDQLAKALESRGFGASRARSSLIEIGFGPRDVAAMVLGGVALAGFLLVKLR
jgi:energy-coupling factor transport system permease protein